RRSPDALALQRLRAGPARLPRGHLASVHAPGAVRARPHARPALARARGAAACAARQRNGGGRVRRALQAGRGAGGALARDQPLRAGGRALAVRGRGGPEVASSTGGGRVRSPAGLSVQGLRGGASSKRRRRVSARLAPVSSPKWVSTRRPLASKNRVVGSARAPVSAMVRECGSRSTCC